MPTLDAFFGDSNDSDSTKDTILTKDIEATKEVKVKQDIEKEPESHLMTVDVDDTSVLRKEEDVKVKVPIRPVSYLPWTKKYAPNNEKDIVGQDKQITKIKDFLENFKTQKKKALMLWGPSGVGKSSCIYALTDSEVIELNASDDRAKSAIEEKLGNALGQKSLFSSSKVVLIDDINGISGYNDRGGAQAIGKLIAKSPYPIIMTCQDPFHKKVSSLKSKGTLIEFELLKVSEIKSYISKILVAEGIEFDDSALEIIAEHSQGDLRAAINDAQMLSIGNTKLDGKILEEMDKRLKNSDMQEILQEILKSDPNEVEGLLDSFNNIDTGFDQHLLWMDYNMPLEYYKRADKARAYGYLSKADLFMKRIMRRQHWRFLVYVNAYLTAGIGSAKSSPYPGEISYKQSTRLLQMWQANMKFAKRKSIAEKIANSIHSSRLDVIKNFEFYSIIIAKEKDGKVAESFDLDEDEIEYVKKLVA